jgi:hypothetical protein
MTGEDLLRGYVYLIVLGGSAWALSVGWLTARAAWRRLRRGRGFITVRSSEG